VKGKKTIPALKKNNIDLYIKLKELDVSLNLYIKLRVQ
jgi:hypothetical protein